MTGAVLVINDRLAPEETTSEKILSPWLLGAVEPVTSSIETHVPNTRARLRDTHSK